MSGYLALGAVFKDETRWLREWIEYHRIVGVEHFHLLCNDDDPGPAREALGPHVESGLVELEPWPTQNKMQTYGFWRIFSSLKDRFRWILFLDADEFALPRGADSLPEVLSRYDRDPIGGLVIHWHIFNSAGHETHPEGKLQIEAYDRRLYDKHEWHASIKTAVRTSAADRPIGSHAWLYKSGFHPVNELYHRVEPGKHEDLESTCKAIGINHYMTRSRDEYARRIRRGWCRSGGCHITAEERWQIWDRLHASTVLDEEISRRFAGRVRAALGMLR